MVDDLAPRTAALSLLSNALRRRRPVDDGFAVAVNGLEDRDRAFVRLLVAVTLRRLGQIDAVLATYVKRMPPEEVQDILRLAVAQLLFVETPAHAAVDTAVNMAKRVEPRTAGLVNAVLRRVSTEGPGIIAAQDAGRLNTPDWLWESWTAAYGADTAHRIAEGHLVEAPLDITLENLHDVMDWPGRLEAERLPTGSLRRRAPGRVAELDGYEDGAWWVQDAAAALPARVLLAGLEETLDKKIADLCAAPGGKTLQLASAGCHVTAVDQSEERLVRLRQNLSRTHQTAEVVEADILSWSPVDPFDGVLLDAPCSATGTIRRHPDLPALKRPEDVITAAALQKRLLARALTFLAPGGVLVYSVCSLQPEEGEAVVDAVLAEHPAFERRVIHAAAFGGEGDWVTPMGDMRILPCAWAERGGMDGFYIACLAHA